MEELNTLEKIKLMCDREKVTQKELAARLGCSVQNLNNKFSRADFRESDLKAIAAALGYDLIIDFVKKK